MRPAALDCICPSSLEGNRTDFSVAESAVWAYVVLKTRHKNAAPHKAESFGIAVNAWMNATGSPRVDHDNKLEGITRTGGGKVVDA